MNTIVPITDAPLIYDISYYQEEFKYGKLPLGKQQPVGFYLNAGIGLVKDIQFARNWQKCGELGYYRQSYWAYHPDYSHYDQLDKWYEQNPLIDMLPRIMDLERVKGVEPHIIAACAMEMSDIILARDEWRPWIYSRKNFLETYILPFWSVDYIDEHRIILAEYNNYRDKEEEGIDIPALVEPDNVLMKQTADQMDPDPLGLCPGFLDRNRWLHGDEYEMDTFLVSTYGISPPPPPPPIDPYDCDLLLDKIEANTNQIHLDAVKSMSMDAALESGVSANASEIANIWNAQSTIKGTSVKNALEIEKLQANDRVDGELIAQLTRVQGIQDADIAKLKEDYKQLDENIDGMIIGMAETDGEVQLLEKRIDENMRRIDELFDLVDEGVSEINQRIDGLDSRIDGLSGGHSHFWTRWFK